jgi:transposase
MTDPLPPELPQDVERCHEIMREFAEIMRELERDLEKKNQQIEWLQRKLFGRRSEKMGDTELTFFGEKPEAPPEAVQPPSEEPSERTRIITVKGHGRQTLPKDLPRKRVEHDLSPAERLCPCCGKERKRIGEDVSEQIEYVPASLYVLEHVRPKYACAHCQEGVVQAPKPAEAIEKGLAGPGLLAHVITSKYGDHLPLNRQEGILARHGIHLSRQTMCGWAMQAAEALEPVVRAMKEQLLQSAAIHSDDTPVPVLERTRTHRAYLWTYLGDNAHPFTVYDFTWTRARDGPEKFMGDYRGYLQADAYAGYEKLYATGRVSEVGCWAHARRKFFDAKTSAPIQAHEALLKIRALYEIERDAEKRELKDDERRALRQEKSRPLLEAFALWLRNLRERVLPKSPLGEAITYALGNWAALARYTDQGWLAIDNNAAERALRSIVIGRKNWLFAGSERGGRAAAILFSLIASAKRAGLDPFAYLRDLLRRLPSLPHYRIGEMLPNVWKQSNLQSA